MHCRKIILWMSAYVDECLGERRRRLVEEHVARCDACRAELNQLREAVALLHAVEPVEPPRDLVRNVRASIQAEREAGRRPFWLVFSSMPARAALAAGLLLVLVFFVGRELPRQSETAVQSDAVQEPAVSFRAAAKEGSEVRIAAAATGAGAVPEAEIVEQEKTLRDESTSHEVPDRTAASAPPPASPAPVVDTQAFGDRSAPARSRGTVQWQAVPRAKRVGGASTGGSAASMADSGAEPGVEAILQSAALSAVSDEAPMDQDEAIRRIDTIRTLVQRTGRWVSEVDRVTTASEGNRAADADGPSATVLLAEIPVPAYEGLKRALSRYREVSLHEQSSTNGIVTVRISIAGE